MIRRGSPLSRAVALMVVCLPALALLAAFSAWAAEAWREASRALRVADQTEQELSAERIQAQAYEGLLARWRDYAASPGSGLFSTADDDRIAADMAARAARAIEEVGGIVLEWTPIGVSETDGLARVLIAVRAEAPTAEIYALLDAIESPSPFVTVDRLVARSASAAGGGRLELRLRLSANRLAGAPG